MNKPIMQEACLKCRRSFEDQLSCREIGDTSEEEANDPNLPCYNVGNIFGILPHAVSPVDQFNNRQSDREWPPKVKLFKR